MRRLTSFTMLSVDGCYADADGDMGFAHQNDPEWNAFTNENAKAGGALIFGRVTYQMMAGFWPTPQAAAQMPQVAERMNALPKIVVSRTLAEATWRNTTLISGNLVGEIRRLKAADGPEMAILGSGSLVAQLAEAGLIDELTLAVNPLVLGGGKRLFDGIGKALALTLTGSRAFRNGAVVSTYAPG